LGYGHIYFKGIKLVKKNFPSKVKKVRPLCAEILAITPGGTKYNLFIEFLSFHSMRIT